MQFAVCQWSELCGHVCLCGAARGILLKRVCSQKRLVRLAKWNRCSCLFLYLFIYFILEITEALMAEQYEWDIEEETTVAPSIIS